jgi:threonine/homoserine/homoserine lactone efflux protein
MALVLICVDLVYFTALAWAVTRAKRALVGSRRIERLTGAVMVALGLRVALESR